MDPDWQSSPLVGCPGSPHLTCMNSYRAGWPRSVPDQCLASTGPVSGI